MSDNQNNQKDRLAYGAEEYGDGKGRNRYGSPTFYAMLEEMAVTHDKKSHDYASNDNPVGNYHFAGKLAQLFAHSAEDAGFLGRLGEKYYRLANLESGDKTPANESIEDTERDIAVITVLWMADRRNRKIKHQLNSIKNMTSKVSSDMDAASGGQIYHESKNPFKY